MADAIQSLMRAYPLDTPEPERAQQRHLQAALTALAATNPRDTVEVMLAVQALSAYQAACASWRLGMNLDRPYGINARHISAAATAARTFDTMLRAMERRQAKPSWVPTAPPPDGVWSSSDTSATLTSLAARIRQIDREPSGHDRQSNDRPVDDPQANDLPAGAAYGRGAPPVWSFEDLALADQMMQQERLEDENRGLDIASTEGILPGGGMIVPENPTPQQAAYVARRLGLMYRREYEANLRRGVRIIPQIRPVRPGDLIT